jgi:hypothetical protein
MRVDCGEWVATRPVHSVRRPLCRPTCWGFQRDNASPPRRFNAALRGKFRKSLEPPTEKMWREGTRKSPRISIYVGACVAPQCVRCPRSHAQNITDAWRHSRSNWPKSLRTTWSRKRSSEPRKDGWSLPSGKRSGKGIKGARPLTTRSLTAASPGDLVIARVRNAGHRTAAFLAVSKPAGTLTRSPELQRKPDE